MNVWQLFTRLFWDEARIQRLEKTMITRQQLDNSIAALPAAIESGVTAAVTPLLKPIADKLSAIPNEDFSVEMELLNGIPGAVSKAVGESVASVFAPVTSPKAELSLDVTTPPPATDGSSTDTAAAGDTSGSTEQAAS